MLYSLRIGLLHCTKSNLAIKCMANSTVLRKANIEGPMQTRTFSAPAFLTSMLETQAGWFQSLAATKPVEMAQQYLISLHDVTGLSWWSSIMVSTILVRTAVTLPFSIYQNYIMARIENLKLEMPALVKQLKLETVWAIKEYKWTEQQARRAYNRSLKKQWDKLIIRDNCHPFKSILVLFVQIPMWVCLSLGLRNLTSMMPHHDIAAQLLYLQLCYGGVLWIPNLTVPDTSYILPVALGLTNLAIIEIQAMSRGNKPKSKVHTYATHFFRGLSLAMIPIAASVPSCMSLYWTTSSACALGHNLLLMSPKFRRFVKIPKTEEEIQKPYSHLRQQIKLRFRI